MKLNIGVAFILGLLLFLSGGAQALVLDEASFEVRITIPVVQELTILEPIQLDFSYPWEGAEKDQPLILQERGRIRICSNSPWTAILEPMNNLGFLIAVKQSCDPRGDWKNISHAVLSGDLGCYEFSFDFKIEPSAFRQPDYGIHTIELQITIGAS